MKSIFFKFPRLYDWGIRFLYLDGLKILKGIVGNGRSVFEPACGYGRLKKYLYSDCTYSGIDLNKAFVEYGKKKKRDIRVGNALEKDLYQKADVILLSDILHHLKIDEIYKLVSIALEFAREKVIIIEPLFVDIATRGNIFSHFLGKVMIYMDADGFNRITRWFSKKEYERLFHSLKECYHLKEMRRRNFRNHAFVEMII